MESYTDSLAFKGSISDAVNEVQKKKKLFIVYISGQDEKSTLLEESTWKDSNVGEIVSRHCILLHLIHGSVDASQFSAIYPQKSVPSISVIGYNGGKLLLQYEEYVSAEKLVADIEKTLASLHLQETAVTVLTAAALASNRDETSSSSSPDVTLCQQDSSSHSDAPTLMNNTFEDSQPSPQVTSDLNSILSEESTSPSAHVNDLEFGRDEQSSLIGGTEKNKLASAAANVEASEADAKYLDMTDDITEPQGNNTLNDHYFRSTIDPANGVTSEVITGDSFQGKKSDGFICTAKDGESVQDEENQSLRYNINEGEVCAVDKKSKDLISCTNAVRSSDVHLSIRLPDGSSLQAKFSMTDSLRMVKDYVDENEKCGLRPYDLAIPYPRRVLDEEDMTKALVELGFINREALIVVPRRSVAGLYRGKPSSHDRTSTTTSNSDSSGDNGLGLFGYAKRMLSYLNPFSYFGSGVGSSSSESASNDGLWQYRPNPGLQSSLAGAGTPYRPYSPNLNSPLAPENVSKGKKVTPAQSSNIHTLKHDEDHGPFSDRNAFWNGNSTQYGGDNNN